MPREDMGTTRRASYRELHYRLMAAEARIAQLEARETHERPAPEGVRESIRILSKVTGVYVCLPPVLPMSEAEELLCRLSEFHHRQQSRSDYTQACLG